MRSRLASIRLLQSAHLAPIDKCFAPVGGQRARQLPGSVSPFPKAIAANPTTVGKKRPVIVRLGIAAGKDVHVLQLDPTLVQGLLYRLLRKPMVIFNPADAFL
jgi:hypothetical protein